MRIALDITPVFQDQPTGVAHYCASVVNALVNYQNQHEYVVVGICPRGLKHTFATQLHRIAPQIDCRILYVPQKIHATVLGVLQLLPLNLIDLLLGPVDIFHQFDGYSLTTHCVTTATVFDLSAQKLPETHTSRNVSIQTKRLAAIRNRCVHFFPISKTIQHELQTDWKLPAAAMTVVYPPIDNRQTLTDACQDQACLKTTPGLMATVSQKNYILSVATREPRKNLSTVIAAFNHLDRRRQAHHPLIIVGAKGWGADLIVDSQEHLYLCDYVCDSCLSYLYARAYVFIYASGYEGFGMPIAEAMKYKVPVICSDIPVFREITEKAALLVDTHHVPLLSRALEQLVNCSQQQRSRLLRRGERQAKIFSGRASASAMVNAWVSLVQSGHENRHF